MAMPDKYVGFLQLIERSGSAFTGAILVTDLKSVPVEFRVTLPLKPTPIQQSLYGETMIPYIGTELCAAQLLKAITHELDLIFVMPDYMLGVRPNSATPVFYLQKAGKLLEATSPNGDTPKGQKHWELESRSFQPLTVVTAANFDEDFNLVRPLLEELSSKFDLLEPFERIHRAIEVLGQQDQRFAK
jgi:hypothetical protein